MSQISKNGIFYNNLNINDRLFVLYGRLKRHLSSEYLELTEKRDNIESDVLQMKIELEKKDKTLFPNQEKKDDRRYFTPLSIEGESTKKTDEKEKQLTSDISRLNEEIQRMNSRMSDITDFLKELEFFKDNGISLVVKDNQSNDQSQDNDENFNPLSLSGSDEAGDEYTDNESSYFENRDIYPQMIRNLYDLSDYYTNTYPGLEVLIEYNDNNLELDPDAIEHILRQIVMNIEASLEVYGISMILIQGNLTEDVLNVSLNYICDDKSFDTVQITYNIVRIH